jgi:hypothetical protein
VSQLRQYDGRLDARRHTQKKLKKCGQAPIDNDPVTSVTIDGGAGALLSVAPRIEYRVPGRFVILAHLLGN